MFERCSIERSLCRALSSLLTTPSRWRQQTRQRSAHLDSTAVTDGPRRMRWRRRRRRWHCSTSPLRGLPHGHLLLQMRPLRRRRRQRRRRRRWRMRWPRLARRAAAGHRLQVRQRGETVPVHDGPTRLHILHVRPEINLARQPRGEEHLHPVAQAPPVVRVLPLAVREAEVLVCRLVVAHQVCVEPLHAGRVNESGRKESDVTTGLLGRHRSQRTDSPPTNQTPMNVRHMSATAAGASCSASATLAGVARVPCACCRCSPS